MAQACPCTSDLSKWVAAMPCTSLPGPCWMCLCMWTTATLLGEAENSL
jgi:hypothetical protein